MTMETTWDKFQKELQERSLCGACGQYYEENQQGDDGYHSPELCDANDEIQEMNTETRNAIREMISKINAIQPFTVGRMKEALAGLPDDTQILIGGDDKCSFDWANLSLDYNRPDEESEEYLALTFYIKDDYDGRQF